MRNEKQCSEKTTDCVFGIPGCVVRSDREVERVLGQRLIVWAALQSAGFSRAFVNGIAQAADFHFL
jgi:hypothetical protein